MAINLAIAAGSICDPVDAPGAVNLLARVIDRGTATRSAEDIADALDSRGISLNTLVSRHQCSLVCTCLAEDFEPVFALLADIVTAPSLPEMELTTRKGEVVTAIRQDEDNPFVRAFESLMAALYGETHPYGRRVKGSIEAVEGLSRERLLRLHGERFAPGLATAVVVGDVEPPRVLEAADRAFGSWRVSMPPPIALSHPAPSVWPPAPGHLDDEQDAGRYRLWIHVDYQIRSAVLRVLADE